MAPVVVAKERSGGVNHVPVSDNGVICTGELLEADSHSQMITNDGGHN